MLTSSMDSTGHIGKEPGAEEVSLQSSSSSALNDNIPAPYDICSGGIDPSEGCLIDLTDERMEAACNISSSSKFISTDLGGQGTSHPDVNLWPLGITMNCKTRGQSLMDTPGQSLVNVLPEHFQLEHSVCNTAVTIEPAVHQLSSAKTNYHRGSHIEQQKDEENLENLEKVANAAYRMEMKDVCTIQTGSLDKTSDNNQKKTSAWQFAMQVEVGTDSSCVDLFSRKTENLHYLQHNPNCILTKAATNCNYQWLSSSVGCHDEALYQVSDDDRDLAIRSQDAYKPIAPEQLKALSLPRPMFLWQYLYPASLSTPASWSTEFVQDKGWHQSSPSSFMWCQPPAKLPISFAAVDALTKTGTSSYLISKPSTTSLMPDHEHLANSSAKSAAEQTAAAMPCLVSSHSASNVVIGSPFQLRSEVCGPQLNMTPVPSAYGTSALDHEVSDKRQQSSENMFRSLSARPCRESLQKSAEKRKALLCSTVNVYGHNQPRCYVPPVNNNYQPNLTQSPFNSQAMTRRSPVNIRAATCQSYVRDQPTSSIPLPVLDVPNSSFPMQSPSSSLSHKGPGHECRNMIECTTCVLDFSKQLALALAFDVMHHRTTVSPLMSSNQQDIPYDKDAKQTTPICRKADDAVLRSGCSANNSL